MILRNSIFAPFAYLLVGIIAGRICPSLKTTLSALLTRGAIPALIVTHLMNRPAGTAAVMLTMIALMTLLLVLSRLITSNPVRNLCFCYLNIGWLGLPIAAALFGERVTATVLAAYISSSIFGNSVGVGLLVQQLTISQRLHRTLVSPPVLGLIVGLLLLPISARLQPLRMQLEPLLKVVVSMCGMLVLGSWLANARWQLADLKVAAADYLTRGALLGLLMAMIAAYGLQQRIPMITDQFGMLALLPLLPPAANIIVLETHYCHTGHSAGLIAWETLMSLIAIAVFSGVVLTR